MSEARTSYRLGMAGEAFPDDVAVGIEMAPDGSAKAAVWWESKGDVDADEAEYDDVPEALAKAEAARALRGFNSVVVVLSSAEMWDRSWGDLVLPEVDKEPIGDISATSLTDREAFNLASSIEEERDA